MIWFNEAREDIKSDNPGISFVDIAKKGGELWKKMSTSEKSVNNCFYLFIKSLLYIKT